MIRERQTQLPRCYSISSQSFLLNFLLHLSTRLTAMETLEGRYVEGMHRALVKSAADANMNLLRICAE